MRVILILCVLCACGKSDNAIDKGGFEHEGNVKRVKEVEPPLDAIAKKAKSVFAETGKFPVGTSKVLPPNNAETKVAGGCCGAKSGPSLNNKCPVTSEWASDPVWKALAFSLEEPTNYRYKYESADGSTFTVTAAGDLDCDDQEAVYTLKGSVVSGKATIELLQPAPNMY